jgi:hypothetical protein
MHKYLFYWVIHRLRQAKFDNCGSILSSSQFSLLFQWPKKWSSLQKWSELTQNNRLANNDLNSWKSLYFVIFLLDWIEVMRLRRNDEWLRYEHRRVTRPIHFLSIFLKRRKVKRKQKNSVVSYSLCGVMLIMKVKKVWV